jgi:hypothetical protein
MRIVVLEYKERFTKTWARAVKKCTAMAVHEQRKSCKGEGEKLHITVQDRDVCTVEQRQLYMSARIVVQFYRNSRRAAQDFMYNCNVI